MTELAEKRGLFQIIFGKGERPAAEFSRFELLNTYQTTFTPFTSNAYQVSTVRSSIDSFARRAAVMCPRHVRRGNGTVVDVNSNLNRILQVQPNPYSTAYKFYYRLATQYKACNNAFIYPVWGSNGALQAMYVVNATTVELLDYQGEMYCRFNFSNGKKYTCPYTDIIHIGSHFNENDIYGENNAPLRTVLETADTFNQSMSKFAELIAQIRGILKVTGVKKGEDLNAQRDKFIKNNMTVENNASGVIVTDDKYEYSPLQDKNIPIPTGQLDYVRTEIHNYFGTNEAIVQNKATIEQENTYYDAEIKPFYIQVSQAMTNALFGGKEKGFGNEISCESNRLQYEKTSEKTNAINFLGSIGAITLDQALTTYGFPPIGGEEGARRVQTLNMINAAKADQYQLNEKPKQPEAPEPAAPDDKQNTEGEQS